METKYGTRTIRARLSRGWVLAEYADGQWWLENENPWGGAPRQVKPEAAARLLASRGI